MSYATFINFPDNFNIGEVSLSKIPDVDDLDGFIFLANKYRNIFRNNFLDNAYIPYENSIVFFQNLKNDSSRVLYGISLNGNWIGHFGAKDLGDNNIVLDNAIRFSPLGGRDLFKLINLSLIELIKKNLPNHNILIIVETKNISALKLHKGIDFKDCSNLFYENLSIDPSNYLIKILNKNDS